MSGAHDDRPGLVALLEHRQVGAEVQVDGGRDRSAARYRRKEGRQDSWTHSGGVVPAECGCGCFGRCSYLQVRFTRLPPRFPAVDSGSHTVYVTNYQDDTVSVIDGSTRTVTATVPVGKGPEGVAVDPGTRTVYVANLVDGHACGGGGIQARTPST